MCMDTAWEWRRCFAEVRQTEKSGIGKIDGWVLDPPPTPPDPPSLAYTYPPRTHPSLPPLLVVITLPAHRHGEGRISEEVGGVGGVGGWVGGCG